MTIETSDVTVLGLGAMGSRMAMNLLKAGHRVTVWNRSPGPAAELEKKGAMLAATPKEASRNADFVVSMVRDNEASRGVWADGNHGALAGMPENAIAIESSTLTPAWTLELAQLCASHAVAFLEAPVAGSRPQADAGQLIYLVGGDSQCLARAKPILNSMGSTVHHTGPVGSAAVVKLMINCMLGVQVAALAELLGMAQQAGLDAEKALEILSATPVASPASKVAGLAMLASNFAPQFPIDLVAKDFGYLLKTAQVTHSQMPMAATVFSVVENAIRCGLQNSNITALAKLYTTERVSASPI